VPLLGQRPQGLRERSISRTSTVFSPVFVTKSRPGADDVAEIELAVDLVALGAHDLLPEVELDPPGQVLEVREAGLPCRGWP